MQTFNLKGDLNSQQAAALEHLDGPQLILAGAGSGKTRVLTYRIAEIIMQEKARPWQIWATTFTNKTAEEMRHRVSNLLRAVGFSDDTLSRDRGPLVSTFHSAGAEVLRRYGSLIGIERSFSIYDDGDALALIKKILAELNLDPKQWSPKTIRWEIDQLKNRGVDPDHFASEAVTYDREITYRVYDRYQKMLRAAQALDFGDLLMESVRLVRTQESVKKALHERYTYFLVDEFQDTNPIQYEWVKLLSAHTQNLCVVGDEDQSIYGWRGADIWNILNFQKDFPSANVIKLERNYRSTKTIVTAASHVIANNTQRMDKTLFSEAENGDPIFIVGARNEYEEADRVVETLKRHRSSGTEYAEMAVFYRTNAQSRVLEERLRASRLNYQVYGGQRFYERAEIKDALSYLKLCVNPSDDIAFLRCVNTPTRGIGKSSIQKIIDHKNQSGSTLLEVAAQEGLLSGKARNGMLAFLDLIGELKHLADTKRDPVDIYAHWWKRSGYVEMLKEDKDPENLARIENLSELENAFREYSRRVTTPTLAGFLDEIALFIDRDSLDKNEKGISLMTLHSSKGLEFEVVCITGLEDGLFPSQQAITGDPKGVEEERRLFYVGMTRARRHLMILFTENRMSYGVTQPRLPSRFLEEIPENFVRFVGEPMRLRKKNVYHDWDSMNQRDDAGLNPTSYEDFDTPQTSTKQKNIDPIFEDEMVVDIRSRDRSPSQNTASNSGTFKRGMRVRHHEYGYGRVMKCDGVPGNERLVVHFEHFGERKFIAKYAQLEVLHT